MICCFLTAIPGLYCYRNPYQTLNVGSYHSLSYIYSVYQELKQQIIDTKGGDLNEELEKLKSAYNAIKGVRKRESENGDDEYFKGILDTTQQCIVVLAITYIGFAIVYFLIKLLFTLCQHTYKFFIITLVTFFVLDNFFLTVVRSFQVRLFLSVTVSFVFLVVKNKGAQSEKEYKPFNNEESVANANTNNNTNRVVSSKNDGKYSPFVDESISGTGNDKVLELSSFHKEK
jgi:hypothetical protein